MSSKRNWCRSLGEEDGFPELLIPSVSSCIHSMLEEAHLSLCLPKLVASEQKSARQSLNCEGKQNSLLTIHESYGKSSCWPLIKSVQGRCILSEPVDLSEATVPDGVSTSRSVLLIYIRMSVSVGNWCSTRGQKSFRKYPHV